MAKNKQKQFSSENSSKSLTDQQTKNVESDDGQLSDQNEVDSDIDLQQQTNSDIADIEDSKQDIQPEDNVMAWGNQKQQFYQSSEEMESSSEEEEQKEAEKIYKLQQEKLNEEDFFDEEIGSTQLKQQIQQIIEKEDDQQNDQKITKDVNILQNILLDSSSELKNLSQELLQKIRELNENVFPLIEIKNIQSLYQMGGNSYIQIKEEILNAYITCIIYYIYLKSLNKNTKNHPILQKLTQFKQQLDILSEFNIEFKEKVTQLIKTSLQQQQGQLKERKKQINKKNNNIQVKQKDLLQQKQKQDTKQLQNKKRQINKELLQDSDEEDERIKQGFKKINPINQGVKNDKKLQDIILDDDDNDLDDLYSNEVLQLKNQKLNENLVGKKRKFQLNNQIEEEGYEKDDDNEDQDEEDEFYQEIQQKQNLKKKQIMQQKIKEKLQKKKMQNEKYTLQQVKEDQPRQINYQILKNRGLVRKRPKVQRNSRVKLKLKYDKAQQKIKSKGIYIREPKSVNYDGEQLGIKAGLIKGVSLISNN